MYIIEIANRLWNGIFQAVQFVKDFTIWEILGNTGALWKK